MSISVCKRIQKNPRGDGDIGDIGDIFRKSLKLLDFLRAHTGDISGDIFGDGDIPGDIFGDGDSTRKTPLRVRGTGRFDGIDESAKKALFGAFRRQPNGNPGKRLSPSKTRKNGHSQSVTNRHQMSLAFAPLRAWKRAQGKTHPRNPKIAVDFVDIVDIFRKASNHAGLLNCGRVDILWIFSLRVDLSVDEAFPCLRP